MMIAETKFVLMMNKPLLAFLHTSTDTIIYLVRMAAQRLDADSWTENERIAKEDTDEGFDCYTWPITFQSGLSFRVEVTPYPRGVLRISVADQPETVPLEADPGVVYVDSDVIMNSVLTKVLAVPGGSDGCTLMGG